MLLPESAYPINRTAEEEEKGETKKGTKKRRPRAKFKPSEPSGGAQEIGPAREKRKKPTARGMSPVLEAEAPVAEPLKEVPVYEIESPVLETESEYPKKLPAEEKTRSRQTISKEEPEPEPREEFRPGLPSGASQETGFFREKRKNATVGGVPVPQITPPVLQPKSKARVAQTTTSPALEPQGEVPAREADAPVAEPIKEMPAREVESPVLEPEDEVPAREADAPVAEPLKEVSVYEIESPVLQTEREYPKERPAEETEKGVETEAGETSEPKTPSTVGKPFGAFAESEPVGEKRKTAKTKGVPTPVVISPALQPKSKAQKQRPPVEEKGREPRGTKKKTKEETKRGAKETKKGPQKKGSPVEEKRGAERGTGEKKSTTSTVTSPVLPAEPGLVGEKRKGHAVPTTSARPVQQPRVYGAQAKRTPSGKQQKGKSIKGKEQKRRQSKERKPKPSVRMKEKDLRVREWTHMLEGLGEEGLLL